MSCNPPDRRPFAHDPSVPEAGSEGVNSADIVRAMMGLPPIGGGSGGPGNGPRTGTTGPRPPPGDAAAAAAAAAAVAASLVASAPHHHHHHSGHHGGGEASHGAGSGLTREQKLQKLWGPKKAEAGEAVVQALSAQAKVDAAVVFGHNRWDAAEFTK